MKHPSHSGTLLRRDFIVLVSWQGTMLAAITLGAYAWALQRGGPGPYARTIALFALVAVQVGHTLNCRSQTESAFRDLYRNPHVFFALLTVVGLMALAYLVTPLARLLGVARLDRTDLAVIVLCVVLPVAIVELQKLVIRWRR